MATEAVMSTDLWECRHSQVSSSDRQRRQSWGLTQSCKGRQQPCRWVALSSQRLLPLFDSMHCIYCAFYEAWHAGGFILTLQSCFSGPQACNPTAISLKAGCELFLRYATRTSALEDQNFASAKERIIQVRLLQASLPAHR